MVMGHVIVGLMLLTPGASELFAARAQAGRSQDVSTLLDAFVDHLESLRSTLDRTQFDVEELSFELAFESPDVIVEWVQHNIAFEPYLGLLRGPTGTLMSRAGNALDQAVLLARLLNDAGYEARIARGELTQEAARRLVDHVRAPKVERNICCMPSDTPQVASKVSSGLRYRCRPGWVL